VESLGAEFIPLKTTNEAEVDGGYASEMSEDYYSHEQTVIAEYLPRTDVVIATAQIFGKRAPLLITEEMVQIMPRGSVIVDLAAEQGGNCELTIPGMTVERNSVIIHGENDLPSSLSHHTSEMFSRNVTALLFEIIKNGEIDINLEDEVVRGALLTHEGRIINQRISNLLERERGKRHEHVSYS